MVCITRDPFGLHVHRVIRHHVRVRVPLPCTTTDFHYSHAHNVTCHVRVCTCISLPLSFTHVVIKMVMLQETVFLVIFLSNYGRENCASKPKYKTVDLVRKKYRKRFLRLRQSVGANFHLACLQATSMKTWAFSPSFFLVSPMVGKFARMLASKPISAFDILTHCMCRLYNLALGGK